MTAAPAYTIVLDWLAAELRLDYWMRPSPARLARKLDKELFIGLEYYSDLGRITHFNRWQDQSHTLFAVSDFKLGIFDVNFGVGFGLTPASDRFVVKSIIGYAFPVPGAPEAGASERATAGPVNPMSRSTARALYR